MLPALRLLAPAIVVAALVLLALFLYLRFEAERARREVPPEVAGDAAREEAYLVAVEIERRRTLASLRRVAGIVALILVLLVVAVWLGGG